MKEVETINWTGTDLAERYCQTETFTKALTCTESGTAKGCTSLKTGLDMTETGKMVI
jgi:hypothetical protein